MIVSRRSLVVGGTLVALANVGCSGSARPVPPRVDPSPAPAPTPVTLPADATWRKLATASYPGKQDDIFFVDPDHGWYVNGGGNIYHTDDGGSTWQHQLAQPGTYFRAIGFVDARRGFAGNIGTDYFPGVTDTTPLYGTDDGGTTWRPVALPAAPVVKGVCAIDVVPTRFVNAGHLDERVVIHAAGRVGGPAFVLRSLDAGRTWRALDLNDQAAMILDIKFFDEMNGLLFAGSDADIARSHGLILRTQDGGSTWTPAYRGTRPFEILWKASFPTREVGYATIMSYDPDLTHTARFVAKTTDGGRTWAELPLVEDASALELGVGFASPQIGWIGARSTGYQTTDGGASWTPVVLGDAANKIRVIPAPGGFVSYAIGLDVYKLTVPTR